MNLTLNEMLLVADKIELQNLPSFLKTEFSNRPSLYLAQEQYLTFHDESSINMYIFNVQYTDSSMGDYLNELANNIKSLIKSWVPSKDIFEIDPDHLIIKLNEIDTLRIDFNDGTWFLNYQSTGQW